MIKVTKEHVEHVYDAVTMMRLSSQILCNGEVDDNLASELSWMLGSCKKRLSDVIDLLERIEGEQERAEELSLPDQIEALEKRLAERRFAMTAGASA